jgi:hypothetical protein
MGICIPRSFVKLSERTCQSNNLSVKTSAKKRYVSYAGQTEFIARIVPASRLTNADDTVIKQRVAAMNVKGVANALMT